MPVACVMRPISDIAEAVMHPREFIAKHIKATLEKEEFPPMRSR